MKGLPEMGLWRADEQMLRVFIAETWWSRTRGLLGHPRIRADQGLWIAPCASVHGIGMGYAIDVLFLDAGLRILRCARLKPWGMVACRHARVAVEMDAGVCMRLGFQAGQILHREPL